MASTLPITRCASSHNKRILAVDDDQGILHAYIDLLQGGEQRFSKLKAMVGVATPAAVNFELFTACQGEKAVELVKENTPKGLPYAVAFIDMRMPPGMNGLATAKAIRAIDPRVFVVIATAYSDHSVEAIVRELGGDVLILRKPFGEDELLQIARTLIDIWNREEHHLQQVHQAKQYGVDRSEASRATEQGPGAEGGYGLKYPDPRGDHQVVTLHGIKGGAQRSLPQKTLEQHVRDYEKRIIKETLAASKHNHLRAARMLETSLITLLTKMNEYGLLRH